MTAEGTTQALVKRDEDHGLPEQVLHDAARQVVGMTKPTAQELRVVEVNEALLPAYQKASTLELTDEEINALMERFPDSSVEIRPHDGLIYIPHIFISDRLNKVFKPGRWALMRRREWFDQGSNTMFGEYVLLIRGCFVGESVGGHPFQPNNPKVNYSDTLESTAAEALRRIAGKRLSCGSQVWEPEYARQWVAKYAEQRSGKWCKKAVSQAAAASKRVDPPQERKAATTAEVAKPAAATEKTRAWMLSQLEAYGDDCVLEYAREKAILLPNEGLQDWPLEQVPTSKDGLRELMWAIEEWRSKAVGGNAETASAPAPQGETIEGRIEKVTTKTGTKKNGESWTLYGIKIGTEWFNTFSSTLGELAQELEATGSVVTLTYEEGEYGKNALAIERAEEGVTP